MLLALALENQSYNACSISECCGAHKGLLGDGSVSSYSHDSFLVKISPTVGLLLGKSQFVVKTSAICCCVPCNIPKFLSFVLNLKALFSIMA